jgi:DNA-binding XRE family transcriptional regulator
MMIRKPDTAGGSRKGSPQKPTHGKESARAESAVRREPPPSIGPRLKQYRLKENLTLNDLQNLTGISKSMLSQIERGAVNPTFARAWRRSAPMSI